MITDKGRATRILIVILFIMYLLIVPVWVIFFKAEPTVLFYQYWYHFEFPDMYMITHFADYANLNPMKILWGDMVLNVIAFVPFGVYLEMLFHDKSFFPKFISIASVSLAIEVLQFIFFLGSTDIVDFIANTLGGVIGLLLMKLLYRERVLKLMMSLAIITTVVVAIIVGIKTVDSYYRLNTLYSAENYSFYLTKVQEFVPVPSP